MKVNEVLNAWTSWDSEDIFEIRDISGRVTSITNMKAVILLQTDLANAEVERFGTYAHKENEPWKHHITIK